MGGRGPEQRSRFGGMIDKLLISAGRGGNQPAEGSTSLPPSGLSGEAKGLGDASVQVVHRTKKEKDFLAQGGIIREADLSRDAGVVAGLYIQRSAREHIMDVTPFTTQEELDAYLKANPLPPGKKIVPTNARETKAYYRNNPGSKLWVAELRGEIVGVVTTAPQMQGGINEVKLNRLVTREDKRGLDIATRLNREALVQSFLIPPEEGGPAGCTIGIILGSIVGSTFVPIEGADIARRVFKKLDFVTTVERAKDRVFGWDNRRKKIVLRYVEIMYLDRTAFARRWGTDLHRGTSLPNGKAA